MFEDPSASWTSVTDRHMILGIPADHNYDRIKRLPRSQQSRPRMEMD